MMANGGLNVRRKNRASPSPRQQERPEHLLLEVLGGIAPVAAVGRAAVRGLDGAQVRLRAEADRRAALRASATTPPQRLWQAVLEILCRLGAGALAGLLGGYGSHVALDALTPAGLPLLA
jgi:hypothetical protein